MDLARLSCQLCNKERQEKGQDISSWGSCKVKLSALQPREKRKKVRISALGDLARLSCQLCNQEIKEKRSGYQLLGILQG
jgi:hypothetical protein